MPKYRIRFEKKVYAYLDIEAENEAEIWKNEEELFSEKWEEDKFKFPDDDWQIGKIMEVEK